MREARTERFGLFPFLPDPCGDVEIVTMLGSTAGLQYSLTPARKPHSPATERCTQNGIAHAGILRLGVDLRPVQVDQSPDGACC